MRIAIVGYGTAGQAAALFLARDGHAIEMFERSAELKPVGAGFLLQPTGLGVCIAAIAENGRGLTDDAGREHGPYDLIIAADGTNSKLRAASGLGNRDPLYPWGAIWCLLPAEDWPHVADLRQRYAGTRTMLGVLPVGVHPDAENGRRWLTFYYSLPGDRVDTFDAQALEGLQRDVAALWPELAERTRPLTEPTQFNRARYRDVVLQEPWRDRTVFIGDSAHGMSPQLGQGVNMALLDAQALADALRQHDHLERALASTHVCARRMSRSTRR